MDSIITMNKNCKGGTDMAHQKEGDSMGLFKKKNVKKSYDRECMKPVIRASICTGEQVAGFKDIQTGKLEEIMLIKSPIWCGYGSAPAAGASGHRCCRR